MRPMKMLLLGSMLALVACGAIQKATKLSTDPTVTKITDLATDPAVGDLVTKVKKLVDGLNVLPASLTGAVPETKLTTIKGWLADLGTLATSVSSVKSIADAKPLITQIGTVIDDVVAAVPAKDLPSEATTLLTAVHTYLPLVEDLVGMVGARHPGASRFGGMSPADAEKVLTAAAATAIVAR